MIKYKSKIAIGLIVFFFSAIIFISCGPSKPSTSDYLGIWKNDAGQYDAGRYKIKIAEQGNDVIINEIRRQGYDAMDIDGLYTINDDGKLNGVGGLVVLSFNKENKKIIMSFGLGGGMLTFSKTQE